MKLFLFFVFKKTLIVYLMFNVQCLLPCAIYSQTTKNTFSNLKFIRRENIFFFIVSYIFILHTNGDIVSTFTHNCLKMRSISLFTSLHTFGGLWEGGIFRISPLYKTVLICKIALTYNFFSQRCKSYPKQFLSLTDHLAKNGLQNIPVGILKCTLAYSVNYTQQTSHISRKLRIFVCQSKV